MKERDWVNTFIKKLEASLQGYLNDQNLKISRDYRLPYSSEILLYKGDEPDPGEQNHIRYETDILISEYLTEDSWKPRVIIECKLGRITTHDAITYSQKAQTHKYVHPYLRYGILIGYREHYPLPGRLFRHGQNFDFMQSWKDYDPKGDEWSTLIDIIKSEIEASRYLEEIIFNSRSSKREHYTVLHRPLKLGG